MSLTMDEQRGDGAMNAHAKLWINSLWALAVMTASVAAEPSPSLVDKFGASIAQTRNATLNGEVRARTLLTVEDNLATLTQAAREGCHDPFITRLAARGGRREARVIGCGFDAPVEDAAAALAFLIHFHETDDSDFRSELRASPTVMGPSLAVAQTARANGETFLKALATGYTTQGRIAAPLGPLQARGLMSAGVWGAGGAAASSASLLNLDAAQTAAALSLGLVTGGGVFQYYYGQTEEKRLILARAARNGVEGALLAKAGVTGAAHVLEGRAGLYRLIEPTRAGELELSALTANFEALEGPLFLYPKFFAASSSILPFLEGLDPVWRARGLKAADVEHMEIAAEPGLARVIGDKINAFTPPQSTIGAKLNLSFVLALYVTTGSVLPADYNNATMGDPAILNLAARTRFVPLPQGGGSKLVMVLKSGERLAIDPMRIDPRAPAPEALAQRRRKFDALTRDVLTPDAQAKLRALAQSLPNRTDMRAWSLEIDRLIRTGR